MLILHGGPIELFPFSLPEWSLMEQKRISFIYVLCHQPMVYQYLRDISTSKTCLYINYNLLLFLKHHNVVFSLTLSVPTVICFLVLKHYNRTVTTVNTGLQGRPWGGGGGGGAQLGTMSVGPGSQSTCTKACRIGRGAQLGPIGPIGLRPEKDMEAHYGHIIVTSSFI